LNLAELVYFAALLPEAGGGFSVTFPDVPGAITQGDTLEEAVLNAREALELTLEGITEDGEDLPSARNDSGVMRRIAKSGALPVAISAETPTQNVRVNVSLDQRLLTRIDRAADASGRTRSGFLAEAARAALTNAKRNT
jgi:predicted RNase H-like HicB family nuclease